MSSSTRHRSRAVLGGGLLTALAACASPEPPPAPSAPKQGGRGLHGQLSGEARHLGDSQTPVVDAEQFARHFQRAFVDGEPRSLIELVSRHPDAAFEALMDASLDPAGEASRMLARTLDTVLPCRRGSFLMRWSDEQRRGEEYRRFREARRACYHHLRAGRIARAVEIDLQGLAEELSPIDRCEAARVRSVGLLVAQRPVVAARVLARSVQDSEGLAAWVGARQAVLHADALRRIGQQESWVKGWQDAASQMGRALEESPSLRDAARWERLIRLRPASAAWAEPQRARLVRALMADPSSQWQSEPGPRASTEGLAQALVGLWQLERGEAAAALVSLERAEVEFVDEGLRGEARLHQARALLDLGQRPAAQVLLTELAVHDRPAGDTALAMLGQLHADEGRIAQGRAYLEKALDRAGSRHWPARARAEADLALVLLIQGHEDEGLQRLHEVQQSFAADPVQLRRALENERRYHEATGDRQRAAEVEARLSTVQ